MANVNEKINMAESEFLQLLINNEGREIVFYYQCEKCNEPIACKTPITKNMMIDFFEKGCLFRKVNCSICDSSDCFLQVESIADYQIIQ